VNELRDDLTIKDIEEELCGGECFEYDKGGHAFILLESYEKKTRPLPKSWLKPKVKKWIYKHIYELHKGDVIIKCGEPHTIDYIFPTNDYYKQICYSNSAYLGHINEFVTVEVEE
jgi:hypothetical protein